MNTYSFSRTPVNAIDTKLHKLTDGMKHKLSVMNTKLDNKKNILDESKQLVKSVYDTYNTEHRQIKNINLQLLRLKQIEENMREFDERIELAEKNIKYILEFISSIMNDVDDGVTEPKKKSVKKVKKKSTKKVKKKSIKKKL